jgi:hypothetical protein
MGDAKKRFVINYFYNEQKRPKEIHDILCEQSKANIPSPKPVCHWIRELRSGKTDLHAISAPRRTSDEGIANVFDHRQKKLSLLSHKARTVPADCPFQSMSLFAKCPRHESMPCSLGPHILTLEQKSKGMKFAKVMLHTLEICRQASFQCLWTGDEMWMFYAYHLFA